MMQTTVKRIKSQQEISRLIWNLRINNNLKWKETSVKSLSSLTISEVYFRTVGPIITSHI